MIHTGSFKYNEVLGMKFGYGLLSKPKMFVHTYFVDGLLIDTGQSRCRKQVLSTIKNLALEQVVITHYHEDHSGNISGVKQLFDIPFYASEACCEIMKNPPNISFPQKILWGNREAQHDLIPLGDIIKTKQFNFETHAIPGHASDMIALYEPERKWLFSADLYVNDYIAYFLKEESMGTQIQSIRKILNLDFDVLFCSHNPQMQGGKQKLKNKLAFFESFFEQVKTYYDKGYTAKEAFTQLKLKEHGYIKLFSNNNLSKLNMVNSIIRDINNGLMPL